MFHHTGLLVACLYLSTEQGEFEVSLGCSIRSSLKNKTQQQKVTLNWVWRYMLIVQDLQEAEAVGSLEPAWAKHWNPLI